MFLTFQKHIASVLLFAFLFTLVPMPHDRAGAKVPHHDAFTHYSQKKDKKEDEKDEWKEIVYDIIAWLLKEIINQLTISIIQWVNTGQFGKPYVSASYLFESSIKADQAARFFLTQLTGLNFCAAFPTFSGRQKMHLKFNLTASLQCTFQADWNKFLKGEDASIRSLLQSADPSNNFWANAVSIQGAKLDREAEAIKARNNEVQAGDGFLSRRDINKQRIQTPGEFLSGHVRNAIKKQFEDSSHADEISELLGNALTNIINALSERILQAGLNLYK